MGSAGSGPDVIQLGLHRTETGFDVAQALAISELRERHAQKLIPTREARGLVIAVVPINTRPEVTRGDMGHQLGEHGAARQHPPFWPTSSPGPLRRESAAWAKISLRSETRRIGSGFNALQQFHFAMTGQQ